MARQNNYGDIQLPDYRPGMLESLKVSQARNLACQLATVQGLDLDTEDEAIALELVGRWYRYDYDNRCWKPDLSKF